MSNSTGAKQAHTWLQHTLRPQTFAAPPAVRPTVSRTYAGHCGARGRPSRKPKLISCAKLGLWNLLEASGAWQIRSGSGEIRVPGAI